MLQRALSLERLFPTPLAIIICDCWLGPAALSNIFLRLEMLYYEVDSILTLDSFGLLSVHTLMAVVHIYDL